MKTSSIEYKKEETIYRTLAKTRLPLTYTQPTTGQLLSKANDKLLELENKASENVKECRKLSLRLVSTDKVMFKVLGYLIQYDVEPSIIISGLVNITKNHRDGGSVTTSEIIGFSGIETSENISSKWLSDNLPKITDIAGITKKISRTERHFSDLYELTNSVYFSLRCLNLFCDFFVNKADQMAGRFIKTSPYIEQMRTGELIVHERPENTPQGKKAAREANEAKYIYKQKAIAEKYKDGSEMDSEDIDIFGTYKTPIAIVLFLIVSVFLFSNYSNSLRENNHNKKPMTNEEIRMDAMLRDQVLQGTGFENE